MRELGCGIALRCASIVSNWRLATHLAQLVTKVWIAACRIRYRVDVSIPGPLRELLVATAGDVLPILPN